MKTFNQLIADVLPEIEEIFPWDLEEMLEENPDLLLVDIREADEFEFAHIKNSLFVPRGILEAACDWNYAETIPHLVKARKDPVVVICRSGNRSILAAYTMKQMGYENLYSLKTGVKGWNDSDAPLFDGEGNQVDADEAEVFFNPPVSADQLEPA